MTKRSRFQDPLGVAALVMLAQVWASAENFPARVLYQGTLMQNGAPMNGPVSMTLRLTTPDGATQYWTSGSTSVTVTNGSFRYPLGTPNEAAFAAINWPQATPYVELTVNGTLLTPRDPLLHVPYSLLADALKPGAVIQGPTLDMGGNRITGVGAPASGTDAANKSYVDSSVAAGGTGVWSSSGANISNANAGNVGIGTSSPGRSLDVAGTGLAIGAASGGARFAFTEFGGGDVQMGFNRTLSDKQENPALYSWAWLPGSAAHDYFQLLRKAPGAPSWSPLFHLTNRGEVGIGTSFPARQLDVQGSGISIGAAYGGTAHYTLSDFGGGDVQISYNRSLPSGAPEEPSTYSWATITGSAGHDSWDVLRAPPGGGLANLLHIHPNGNVGIGTAAPGAKLEVAGAILLSGNAAASGPSIQNNSDGILMSAGAGFGVRVNNQANTAELMRVTNAGNVGIGTNAPSVKLEVQGGPIKAAGGLILQTLSASDTSTPRPTTPGSLWFEQ